MNSATSCSAAISIFGAFGYFAIASARIAVTISQPSSPVISFQPCAPLKMTFQSGILLGDDAGQRLDHQRRVDAVGLQLRARDGEIGIDDDDVLAEVDALGVPRRSS